MTMNGLDSLQESAILRSSHGRPLPRLAVAAEAIVLVPTGMSVSVGIILRGTIETDSLVMYCLPIMNRRWPWVWK